MNTLQRQLYGIGVTSLHKVKGKCSGPNITKKYDSINSWYQIQINTLSRRAKVEAAMESVSHRRRE